MSKFWLLSYNWWKLSFLTSEFCFFLSKKVSKFLLCYNWWKLVFLTSDFCFWKKKKCQFLLVLPSSTGSRFNAADLWALFKTRALFLRPLGVVSVRGGGSEVTLSVGEWSRERFNALIPALLSGDERLWASVKGPALWRRMRPRLAVKASGRDGSGVLSRRAMRTDLIDHWQR